MAADRNVQADQADAGGEPALLVVFAVVGQVALGNDAQQPAARDRQRAVVEAPGAADGRPDADDRRQVAARLDQPRERGLDRVEQRVLQVQIVDRVGGQRQLGKDHQIDALGVRPAPQVQDPLGVGVDIAHRPQRRRRGDAQHALVVESVKVHATCSRA